MRVDSDSCETGWTSDYTVHLAPQTATTPAAFVQLRWKDQSVLNLARLRHGPYWVAVTARDIPIADWEAPITAVTEILDTYFEIVLAANPDP